MTVLELLPTLEHVRHNRDGWVARCPAHPDRNPSLSIAEGSDGKTLLKCFAGCTVESICRALHIRMSDLFGERGTARKEKPDIVRRAERQIEGLRSRLTPSARLLPVTIVQCSRSDLDVGIARALALTAEGELVQCVLSEAE